MNKNTSNYIAGVLWQIFRDGYRPSRKAQSYNVILKNGVAAYKLFNCVGHACFNLTNQQFEDYNLKLPTFQESYFGSFLSEKSRHATIKNILNFISKTGLEVEKCKEDDVIDDFKSWKIALYTAFDDYHCLIEDEAGSWSGKISYTPDMEQYNLLPKNLMTSRVFSPIYTFYGTYKVTNIYADPENKYVKEQQ